MTNKEQIKKEIKNICERIYKEQNIDISSGCLGTPVWLKHIDIKDAKKLNYLVGNLLKQSDNELRLDDYFHYRFWLPIWEEYSESKKTNYFSDKDNLKKLLSNLREIIEDSKNVRNYLGREEEFEKNEPFPKSEWEKVEESFSISNKIRVKCKKCSLPSESSFGEMGSIRNCYRCKENHWRKVLVGEYINTFDKWFNKEVKETPTIAIEKPKGQTSITLGFCHYCKKTVNEVHAVSDGSFRCINCVGKQIEQLSITEQKRAEPKQKGTQKILDIQTTEILDIPSTSENLPKDRSKSIDQLKERVKLLEEEINKYKAMFSSGGDTPTSSTPTSKNKHCNICDEQVTEVRWTGECFACSNEIDVRITKDQGGKTRQEIVLELIGENKQQELKSYKEKETQTEFIAQIQQPPFGNK